MTDFRATFHPVTGTWGELHWDAELPKPIKTSALLLENQCAACADLTVEIMDSLSVSRLSKTEENL